MGGTEGLFIALSTIIGDGDEIITTDPSYLGYTGVINFLGAKQVRSKVNWKEDFQMSADRINESITNKTKAILMLSPDNPTGSVQSDENVKSVVELCEDKDLWLIADDV